MEKQISFIVKGLKLYGMLHLPSGKGPFPALTMLHGFTGQRVEPHRLFVKIARKLAPQGIAVLRFDFRGSGESEGDFKDMTVSGEIEDALASLDFLASQPEVDKNRMGVLGLSMGGFVASCVAAKDPRVKFLVLWAAGARPFQMFPRYVHLSDKNVKEWMETGERDFGGIVLGSAFLKDLKAFKNPVPRLSKFKGKSIVIHGSADTSVPVSEAAIYQKTLGRKAQVHILEGADHTFNRAGWEKTVIDLTRSWLAKNA